MLIITIVVCGFSAMYACSRFVYLCGGWKKDTYSDQVLRYDSQTNTFETLTPMKNKKRKAVAVFYQGSLLVLGGHNENPLNLVEKYEPSTKEWTDFAPMNKVRNRCKVAILDGKLYACGGDDTLRSVEVFDPPKNSWQLLSSMNKNRRQFLLIAHEGKLLAIGGDTENTVEEYDPKQDQWQLRHEMSSGLEHQFIWGGGLMDCMLKRKLAKSG